MQCGQVWVREEWFVQSTAVRGTMAKNAQDKMIQTGKGETIITNDGVRFSNSHRLGLG